MKNKEIFYNPFRLISPKLDSEASRLEQIYESPPEEVTCLEEGLLIMMNKVIRMTALIRKSLLLTDPAKLEECRTLAKEIHDEEKGLTGNLVCDPNVTKGEVLKTVVLFPARLERVGDFLESVLNVACIKADQGIAFSEKANKELDELFDLFTDILTNFHDVLVTRNHALLEHIIEQCKKFAQLAVDARLAHEDRLLEGLCSPKSSSLFLDILDSMKSAKFNIREMTESLLKLRDNQPH